MKRRVFFLFLAILANTNLLYASVYDFIIDNLYYKYNSSTSVTLTYPVDEEGIRRTYTNLNGELVIPETVVFNGTTYQVTLVDNYAFCLTGITSLTIPNSVTMIGENSFSNCSKLTSVTIGNSMKTIGKEAFAGCTSLTTVTINSTNNIMDYAFMGCIKLTSLALPNNLFNISESAFKRCGLQSVTIPDRVSNIASYAFDECADLTTISIGKSLTSIGYNVFANCNKIRHLIWNAKNFENSFYGFFPTSIIETVTIGDEVQLIPRSFMNGSKITSVIIPSSVTSIGANAFNNCQALESIQVASGNTVYDSREGCNAIIEKASNTLVVGCKTTVIPYSVTTIGESAFDSCKGLSSVNLPTSVKTIKKLAFNDCTGLTSFVLPASVFKIDQQAFRNCTGITKITSQSQRPPAAYDNTFEGINYQSCIISVPSGSLQSYWTATGWNNFEHIIEEESSSPIRGDINGDGKVDISDVNEVINIMLGKQ